jgi:hypothetical protein
MSVLALSYLLGLWSVLALILNRFSGGDGETRSRQCV